MTITTLDYSGTGLSFDGAAVHVNGAHVTGMFVGVRPDAVSTDAAAAANQTTSKTANKIQGIRPRRPEPA